MQTSALIPGPSPVPMSGQYRDPGYYLDLIKARDVETIAREIIGNEPNFHIARTCLLETNSETVVWFEDRCYGGRFKQEEYDSMLFLGSLGGYVDEALLGWLISHRKATIVHLRPPRHHLLRALQQKVSLSRLRWLVANKLVVSPNEMSEACFNWALRYPEERVIEILDWIFSFGVMPKFHILLAAVEYTRDPRTVIPWLVNRGCAFEKDALSSVPRRLDYCTAPAKECISLGQWLMDAFALEVTDAYYDALLDAARVDSSMDLLEWALPHATPSSVAVDKARMCVHGHPPASSYAKMAKRILSVSASVKMH